MTGTPPRCSASFGKSSSPRLFACSFCDPLDDRLRKAGGRSAISSAAVIDRYQSSSVFISLNSAIDSR